MIHVVNRILKSLIPSDVMSVLNVYYMNLTVYGYSKTRPQFHNQWFTLSVNPNNCWPNFKWFAVLFKQIQLM